MASDGLLFLDQDTSELLLTTMEMESLIGVFFGRICQSKELKGYGRKGVNSITSATVDYGSARILTAT